MASSYSHVISGTSSEFLVSDSAFSEEASLDSQLMLNVEVDKYFSKPTYLDSIKTFREQQRSSELKVEPWIGVLLGTDLTPEEFERRILVSQLNLPFEDFKRNLRIIWKFAQNSREKPQDTYTNIMQILSGLKRLERSSYKQTKGRKKTEDRSVILAKILHNIKKCPKNMAGDDEVEDTKFTKIATLLEMTKQMQAVFKQQIETTASDRKVHGGKLKQALSKHKSTMAGNIALEENAKESIAKIASKIEAISKKNDGLRKVIADVRVKSKEAVQKLVFTSSIEMGAMFKEKTLSVENVQTQIDVTQKNLKNLIDANVLTEQISRLERSKVQAQLAAIIEKYDRTIIEKQDCYDELQKTWYEQATVNDELQCQIHEQEPKYNFYLVHKDQLGISTDFLNLRKFSSINIKALGRKAGIKKAIKKVQSRIINQAWNDWSERDNREPEPTLSMAISSGSFIA